MQNVSDEAWLALRDKLSPERQHEAVRDDTATELGNWLDGRITARSVRLRFATEEQSRKVLAKAGTLEGYDG